MTKDKLLKMYYNEKMSISDIIKETGLSRYKISKLLEKYNIPKRSMSDTINGIKSKIVKSWKEKDKKDIDNILLKRKKTNIEKYGVEHGCQSEEVKDKIKKTNIEKYGVENIFQSKEIQDKQKETMLERYGVENGFQSEIIKEKIKNTNIERYGVEKPSQSQEIYAKQKETMLERYGVENSGQMKDHSEKLKQAWDEKTKQERKSIKLNRETTMVKKYGVKYLIHDKEHLFKMQSIMLEKYDCKYGFCSNDIQEICQINKNTGSWYKEYMLPSGKIVNVMGYEPQCLDILLNMYSENELIIGAKDVPIISYIDKNGNNRKYYPDIFIPNENKLIEVKSEYTFLLHEEDNLLKQLYSCKAGYKHIIMILNENGDILNEIHIDT